jgi:hypothetical protein
MASTAKNEEHVNGFGMSDEQIKKLVARELRYKVRNQRAKIAHKLLQEKIKAAGIEVSDEEIDAEIAKLEK